MSSRAFYRDAYAAAERGGHRPEDEPTFDLRVGHALATIGPTSKRVLDFGCGSGAASRLLVDAGHQVTGVDVSESGIRVATREVHGATFHLIDNEGQLPFADASFDVCFCTEVIEHLLDVPGFLREIHRVLADQGMFIITTPYHGWIKNLIIITRNFDVHFSPTDEHVRFFSRSSLTRALVEAGFRVESFRGIGRFWPIWKSMFVVARRHDEAS